MIDYTPSFEIEDYTFEEVYISPTWRTTTLYFITGTEILNGHYPEAEHATLSIEYKTGYPEAIDEQVMVSPTADGLDYDWHCPELPKEFINQLIGLYLKSGPCDGKLTITN